MSALPPKADMAPTARDAHQVKKQPPATITNLSPPLLNALKLAPPIPNAQACRRALADCTEWDGAITSGAVSSPLVSAAVHAKHGCAPLCAAWLRHDAKMLVTPRASDAIWGMAADKPLRLRGAVKAASISNKEKGPTRPAPRFHLFGPKRREDEIACRHTSPRHAHCPDSWAARIYVKRTQLQRMAAARKRRSFIERSA